MLLGQVRHFIDNSGEMSFIIVIGVMEQNLGDYQSEEVALFELTRRLAVGLKPQKIFLFGSRARRDHRPDSDFDFLVVTNFEDGENGRDWGWVRKPLRGSGVGCDIVPVRIDDFEAELHSNISMIPSIMREAVEVYDVKEGFRIPDPCGSRTRSGQMFA